MSPSSTLPLLRWCCATAAALAQFADGATSLGQADLPVSLKALWKTAEIETYADLGVLAVQVFILSLWELLLAIPQEVTSTFLTIWWAIDSYLLGQQANRALRTLFKRMCKPKQRRPARRRPSKAVAPKSRKGPPGPDADKDVQN